MVGTILGGFAVPAFAQDADPLAPAAGQEASAQQGQVVAVTQPQEGVIRSIRVSGNSRIEPETVIAYANLRPGDTYTGETLDAALRALYATSLFRDVVITGAETGELVIAIQENPVINRIVLEGNRRLKDDKIAPEVRLAPRQIFTTPAVRADVDRIIELYKREGRYGAVVEPKIVELSQNRVDLVFEINEGEVSKIRSINIIGNEQFDDGKLRKEMFSKEAGGILGFLKSNDTYDPDRLSADQQKLRAFYLTEGYADFRVVSALAELTPDREDFVITYVVEEGPRYQFGEVSADSALRDMPNSTIMSAVSIKDGDYFDASKVEDNIDNLNQIAGLLGYAFADISPRYFRNADDQTIDITFRVAETPRVYVDRIDINGNTVTRDNVIRREFRLAEGDAFNAAAIRRSEDRIKSLGFFQEELEIKQEPVGDDRVKLSVDLEERSTGEVQLSAGFSSLERFLLSASIAQRNFMGKGQQLSAGVNWSRYSKSVQLGFVEPYFLGRQILLGGDIYRRDLNSFNFIGGERNTTYEQKSTGGGLRLGFPVTEYLSFGTRYRLVNDNIDLSRQFFFTDFNGNGELDRDECDPLKAGNYLCDELGTRVTSALGYTLAYNDTNGIRATRGQRLSLSQDFAGLGGDVKYLRTSGNAAKYFALPADFVLSVQAEGGYIHALEDNDDPFRDEIRLTDRFFGPQSFRGFDIRGIGPRVERLLFDVDGNLVESEQDLVSNALGGRAYYFGRVELEIPVSASFRNFGLRPSAFVDVGSVWNLTSPELTTVGPACFPTADNPDPDAIALRVDPGQPCPTDFANNGDYGFTEFFRGNSAQPRVSVGIGVNWVSPFGPLRLDLAKAIVKQEGDDTRLFSFNVGTQF
ncbi:outer membrane protein assembly factor BamA [Sphingomicrobium flavum]|uniref:outer membrane protein assembly factor BamA n=1 Tax=Sphingomicrobium flavum TaxID=1229164 RepID=UPI0021AD9B4E|nr:outer membrane protein assembly factor BamA [Sphingomicrobium flavum]